LNQIKSNQQERKEKKMEDQERDQGLVEFHNSSINKQSKLREKSGEK
jgi:hypothetical protein